MRKENLKLIQNYLRKIVNRCKTIKCNMYDFQKMFWFKSNDYYAENHSLK